MGWWASKILFNAGNRKHWFEWILGFCRHDRWSRSISISLQLNWFGEQGLKSGLSGGDRDVHMGSGTFRAVCRKAQVGRGWGWVHTSLRPPRADCPTPSLYHCLRAVLWCRKLYSDKKAKEGLKNKRGRGQLWDLPQQSTSKVRVAVLLGWICSLLVGFR